MSNERLRRALASRSLTVETVAEGVAVDSKTVRRWISGRIPHARHRWALAALLGQDEEYLWPVERGKHEQDAGGAELLTLYPHRADVPSTLWRELFERATREVGVLVYAALFLPEQHVDFIDLLRAKAAAGCRIRLILGDPTSAKLLERGAEEKFGNGISSRAELALLHYSPLQDVAGVEVRTHETTLYNSIYRFDDEMLVNAHVFGLSAFAAPVLHMRRLVAGGLFDTYVQSFEAVWAAASPAYSRVVAST
jgi:hypothetical protein